MYEHSYLQIRKLRHREVKWFHKGHTTSKWLSQNLNPGCFMRERVYFSALLNYDIKSNTCKDFPNLGRRALWRVKPIFRIREVWVQISSLAIQLCKIPYNNLNLSFLTHKMGIQSHLSSRDAKTLPWIIPEHGGVSTKSNKALSDGVLGSPRKWASFGFWALASYPPGSSFLSQGLCRVSSGDHKVTPGAITEEWGESRRATRDSGKAVLRGRWGTGNEPHPLFIVFLDISIGCWIKVVKGVFLFLILRGKPLMFLWVADRYPACWSFVYLLSNLCPFPVIYISQTLSTGFRLFLTNRMHS